MMTQPAGAGGGAARPGSGVNVAPADVALGVIADAEAQALPAAPGAGAALFSQALQALASVPDARATAPQAAGASAADATIVDAPGSAAVHADMPPAADGALATAASVAPQQAAARGGLQRAPRAAPIARTEPHSLPKDLLQALSAAKSTLPVQAGTQQPAAIGESDDDHDKTVDVTEAKTHAHDAASAAPVPVMMPTQPQAADANTSLLAALLQWLQPARGDSNARDPASAAPAVAGASAIDAPDASEAIAAGAPAASKAGSTTTTIPTGVPHALATSPVAQAPAIPAGSARSDVAAPIAEWTAAASAMGLAGKASGPRDDESRAAATAAIPLPRDVGDSGAGALGMAAALRAASATHPAQVERTVAVPVHDRHWPAAVATQVLILSNDKMQAATLRLSPEHLGPVEVRIDVQDANVNLNFSAAHADTRAALEQALPQLRAVLAGAGLTLGQATVQQQARGESQNPPAPPRANAAADAPVETPAAVVRALGIIDEYA